MTDDARPDEPPDAPDPGDQALLDALGRALGGRRSDDAADDADLIGRCEGLLTWIGVDAELAELLDASPAELAGTRGSGSDSDRSGMEFSLADGSCLIEVDVVDGAVRGQVLGVTPARLALRIVTGVLEAADVDGLGAFEFVAPPPGSARIEIDLDGGRRIHTDWFVI